MYAFLDGPPGKFPNRARRRPTRLKLHEQKDLGELIPKTPPKPPNEARKQGKIHFSKISPGLRPGPRFLSLFSLFLLLFLSPFLSQSAGQKNDAQSHQHRTLRHPLLCPFCRSFHVALGGAEFSPLWSLLPLRQAICRPRFKGHLFPLSPILNPTPCGPGVVPCAGGNLSPHKSGTRPWHILSDPGRVPST